MINENLNDTNDLESTKLLKNEKNLHDKSPEEIAVYLNANSKPEELEICQAIKDIINTALPTILFFISLALMQAINIMFMARTTEPNQVKDVLNAMGISHLYVNCFLLSLATGIVTAFGTLGANAFSSKNYYLMGLYFHRAQLIGYATTTCLLIIHYFCAVRVYSLLRIDSDVLFYVDRYIKLMMFYVLFEIQYLLNMIYLNIIGKSHMNYIIFLSTLLLHPVWCYIFIVHLDLGIKGAAISLVFSQMLNAMEGLVYIYVFNPLPESIFFYNRNSFQGLWEYLQVAIPITVVMFAEWFGLELISLVALWISKIDYTVHILLVNLCLLTWGISGGIGLSATIIVGKAICDKDLGTVKKHIKIFLYFSILIMIVIDLILICFRKNVLRIYVNDEAIIAIGAKIIPLACVLNICNIMQYVFSNVFKAIGKELLAGIISIIYYNFLVILWAGFFGKWLGWGVWGIWFGITLNELMVAATYSLFLYVFFDFEKIQLNVLQNLQNDKELILLPEEMTKNENLTVSGTI